MAPKDRGKGKSSQVVHPKETPDCLFGGRRNAPINWCRLIQGQRLMSWLDGEVWGKKKIEIWWLGGLVKRLVDRWSLVLMLASFFNCPRACSVGVCTKWPWQLDWGVCWGSSLTNAHVPTTTLNWQLVISRPNTEAPSWHHSPGRPDSHCWWIGYTEPFHHRGSTHCLQRNRCIFQIWICFSHLQCFC